MRFMIFILMFLAGLLALEGLSMLLRRRSDPKRVRERLRTMAARVSQKDTGDSILRGPRQLRSVSGSGLEKLLYRAGGKLTLARFLWLCLTMGAGGFGSLWFLFDSPVRAVP